MMNLEYKTGRDFLLSDIRFDSSLTGCEDVTSTKPALELMKIRNPSTAFTNDAKRGAFDHLDETEYKALLDMVACICRLWKYPDEELPDGKSTRPELNPLMLLANAIELISIQHAALRKAGVDLYPRP